MGTNSFSENHDQDHGWKYPKEPRCYGWSGLCSPAGAEAEAKKFPTLRIMSEVFDRFWELTDRYIRKTEDIPWWYTERSCVGFLTAAAFSAGYVAVEEFGVIHGSSPNRGRGDWWVGLPDASYEVGVETKGYWAGPDTKWETIYKKLAEAPDQLNWDLSQYGFGKESGQLALCFARASHKGDRNAWEDWFGPDAPRPDPRKLSYISYYFLDSERFTIPEGRDKLLYPGLVICCREKKS